MLGTVAFVFLVLGLAYFLRAFTDRKLKYIYRGFLCWATASAFGLVIWKYYNGLLNDFFS